MRILVFNWRDTRHPAAGGAEVYTEELTQAWAAAGHDVTLFCAAVAGAPADERASGVRIVRRGTKYSVYRAGRRFWQAEGGGRRYDLVIDEVNTRPFSCPTFVNDTPVVALIYQVAREVWFREMPFPLALLGRFVLEPWWLRAYRSVPTITISESSRDSLRSYGLQHVEVLPVGVRIPEPVPSSAKEPDPTCLFVGRLAANKRPDHAVRAFRLVKDHVPNARLWVVGEGPMLHSLQRQAAPNVTFFGRVDEATKFELMRRAHVLMVTSVREGWGMVVSEAAAVGTTSVGYDVPGLRDSVRAAGGIVVDPTIAALATAVVESLRSSSVAPADGAAGVLAWPAVAERFLSVALEGLGAPGPPPAASLRD